MRRAFLTAESIEPARPRRRAALEGEATRAGPAERTQLDAPPEPQFNILAQAVASPPASLTTAPILTDAPATPSPVPPGATDLIQAPASVTAATDDFFAGLVRRVERRA